jgi:6-phosphofructokinase
MGARGEMNIIKKIPVSSDFGYLIIDSFTSTHDWLDASSLTLNSLEFVLKDVKGNVIPLHGSHVSFSIVFSKLHLEDN